MASTDACYGFVSDLFNPTQNVGIMSGCSQSDWVSPTLSFNNFTYNCSYPTPHLAQGNLTPSYHTQLLQTPGSSPFQPLAQNVPLRSSPNAFQSDVESIGWAENPLRIKHEAIEDAALEISPTLPSRPETPYFPHFPASSTPKQNLAPNRCWPISASPASHVPTAVQQPMGPPKRFRDIEESTNLGPKRQRRADSVMANVELNEEERLLLRLKDEECLPWKDIAIRFHMELGKVFQVPALQMRYKRLREKLRIWNDTDVQALQQAHDYWEKCKFDIIASKMLEFGASEKWPAKSCARKWEELHPEQKETLERPGNSQPKLLDVAYDDSAVSF
ncbi:hypothetical protein L228DRAFT_237405 [Xylona heveae TC161]|uniref:Myb-like domain-containing protein n=1 Tax=Xylona heveae (strain CBS 132557 / TC161) TaxID=1328760 RepID=A0A165I6Z1_XYLHT|nr:hypothetical protein L228DRAFT_237405 [Xylona heveae TC161]KZF24480.1 hypothetical protein L228DRAFT_237405 [Xylona heveae TC161]